MLKRKPANRRREQRTLRERLRDMDWRRVTLVGAGVALLGGGALALRWALDEPVGSITVVGELKHVAVADLERVARAGVRGKGLVNVPVAELRRSLRQLAWVDDVAVERIWPHALKLHVTEQSAVARWNVLALVNRRGQLFSGGTVVPAEALPQLSGPEGTSDAVVARFNAIRASLAAVPGGHEVQALSLDARGAWELTLRGGLVVRLGRNQVDARFRRLIEAALPAVAAQAADVNYIDMRYTNGFAVNWKAGPARLAALEQEEGLQPDA